MEMKKTFSLMLVGLLMFSLVGTFVLADEENQTGDQAYATGLDVPDEVRAYWIAKEACSNVGEISDEGGTYNENSETWWFDLTPFEEKSGCNPACVVFLSNESAEVNWRCTGLDENFEDVELAWRTNRILRRAERRIERIEKFTEAGEYEKAMRISAKHERDIERAEIRLENFEEDGNAFATRRALAKTIVFQNRIEAHEERALEIKSEILERQGDKMTDEQLAHLEEVFSNIETRAEKTQERVQQRQDNLRAKYKVLTGMNDWEVDESLEEYDSFLEEQRMIRGQKMEEHREKIQEKKNSRIGIEEVEGSGENESEIEEENNFGKSGNSETDSGNLSQRNQ